MFGLPEDVVLPEADQNLMASISDELRVPLAGADIVLRVGWHSLLRVAAGLLADHDIDGLHSNPSGAKMSRACYDECINSLSWTACPQDPWRNWDGPHLMLLPRPRVARSEVEASNPIFHGWQKLDKAGLNSAPLLKRYMDLYRQKLATFGITLVSQASETLTDTGLTRAEFCRDAPGWVTTVLPEHDVSHMNAAFGAIQWRSILAEISEANLAVVRNRKTLGRSA